MEELFLARHGHTRLNIEHRFNGQNEDPLLPQGIEAAQRLAQWLDKQTVPDSLVLISSPLRRAVQTAEILQEVLPGKPELYCDDRLAETNFGAWEGLSGDELEARYPGALDEWRAKPLDFPFPDGETARQTAQRAIACLQDWRSKVPDQRIFLVSHGGPIRALVLDLIGAPLEFYWNLNPPWASLSVVELGQAYNRLRYFGQTG
jgi:broad specificity phosphatase PhoE